MENENEKLKAQNTELNEKIKSLEQTLQAKEKTKMQSNNKREKFVDINGLIESNSELKALNRHLTNACEDMKKENEIILEDYRNMQMLYEELQHKYMESLDENTHLKNTFHNLRNQGKNEIKTAAEKPKIFFENKETIKSVSSWSNNLFPIKKTEFPNEFVKSKLVYVPENEIKKNNDKSNDLRLSNYKEKEDYSRDSIKNLEFDTLTNKMSNSNFQKTKETEFYESNRNEIIDYMKKEADPKLIFPFKKQFDYFESKSEKNAKKGKVFEFNQENFQQIKKIKNIEEFKVNCLKSKCFLFANEIFEINLTQINFHEKNNVFKFVLGYSNLSKNHIENFKINFHSSEKCFFF